GLGRVVHQAIAGKADFQARRAEGARGIRVRDHVQPQVFLDDGGRMVRLAFHAWKPNMARVLLSFHDLYWETQMIFRLVAATALSFAAFAAQAQDTIKIGLVTALSGQSARAGEAITRGLQVAIDEINAKGGVLGRKLELLRRDDESIPAKGVIAARELYFKEKVAVLIGGLDSPVALAIVPIANENKLPFMDPWAAGTPITKNGAKDNYVFRVSAVDELVDKAMLQYAQKTYNARKPGMILVNNPWGESNEKGLTAALKEKNIQAAGIEKFEGNDVDVVPQLSRLKSSGTDVLFLVGNVG